MAHASKALLVVVVVVVARVACVACVARVASVALPSALVQDKALARCTGNCNRGARTEAEAQCGTKGGWLSRAEGVFGAKRKAKTAKWHLPAAQCNE